MLCALLEQVRSCTVIFGEPGIGKTRLLAEARKSDERNIFSIACVPAASDIPHDPLIALMRSLKRAGRVDNAALNALLGAAERDRLAYFHDMLAEAAAQGPLVIQLDDLHLADAKSLEVVHYCASRLQDLPISWHLAARRSNHAVLALASSLERAGLARVVSLSGLSALDLKTLATHLRPEVAFNDAQVARLYERTGGNPLYAELLLVAKALDEASVPTDLREALQRRLFDLSPDALHIAGWLAVHTDAMPESLLMTLALRSPAQVRAALAELADLWVICESPDGFVFRHDLLREACYLTLDEISRTVRHATLAKRAGSDWQRAAHLEGAKEFAAAARLFSAIGWECLDRHAPQEALNAFSRAVDRAHPDDWLSIEAGGGRAAALFRMESFEGAKEAMASFEAQAESLPAEIRIRVRTYYIEAAWDESDERASILQLLRPAIAEARRATPSLLPRLLCVLGSLQDREGEPELAKQTLEEGIALCDPEQHKRERIRLYSWLGVVLARLGDVQKGRAVLEAAAGHASDWGLSNELVLCCTKLCYVSRMAGDNNEFERWCRVGLAVSGPKSKAAEAMLRSNLASVAIDRGRMQEALGFALTADAGAPGVNGPLRSRLVCLQAQLYAMLGEFEAAQRVLDDGMRLQLSASARQAVAFTAGFVAELREDYEQALNWYAAAISALNPEEFKEVYEVRALGGIVRLAALRGEAERARVALAKLRLVSAKGWPIAQRSMREAEGCLLLVQGDTGGADELVDAANDGEYPFWRAHLHVIAAHAKADRQLFLSAIETFDALGAEHAADRARALARSHGLRPGRKREARGTLSARETSVAFLVASGKTNAEIGELLHISGRTVEYHIGNILGKCGLRSRVEIAAQIAAGRPLGAAV
ncbi:MAG: LuxR C-terminal-related transcriptional regulator [Candidatus Eremiobacteraeota bacterium]|nr:LuxR C-terminal-related transcriptional regulator [Candidatus Eremiobacteraeota bacterium]